MFSFLTAPALSESETAQTAAGVTQGFKAGEEENAAKASDEAAAAKETQREKSAADLETAKANAASLAKKVADLRTGAKETYDTTRGKLTETLGAYEKVMDPKSGVSPNSDEYLAAAKNYKVVAAHRDSLDAGRAQYLSSVGETPEAFDPNVGVVPGAPPNLPLTPQAKAAKEGKEEAEAISGPKAALEYERLQKTEGAVKVPPHAATAADNFSGAQSLLVPQAQRVAALEKASAANPDDKTAESALNRSRDEFQKTRDLTIANYQKTINGLASGDYGNDVKSAYAAIATSLPAGTDPAQIENHGRIRAALAAKQAAGTLTPADEKLGKILRTDQDVSGAWRTSGLPSNRLGSPGGVLQSIQNEGAPLMPAPSTTGSSTTTGAPLLPPPDNNPLSGGSSF